MKYDREATEVILQVEDGKITLDNARRRLEQIEEEAYARDPDAEPDGDITYCIALAHEKIQQLFEKQKNEL